MQYKTMNSDVLVIGSGGAGLRSAMEAGRQGVNVLLVSKSPLGSANCTAYGSTFSVATKGAAPDDLLRKMMATGCHINNRKLCRILVEEAPKEVLGLSDYGIKLEESSESAGTYFVEGKPPVWGLEVTGPLVKAAKSYGVKMLESVMMIGILKQNRKINGAIGYDFKNNLFLAFATKSIIIATGGAGGLYEHSSNPSRTTGDGYAMAYSIGVEFQDMEFIQFYPLATNQIGFPKYLVPPIPLADAGKILNVDREDIPEKYGITKKPIAIHARDLLSRAIFLEMSKGPVYLDLTGITKDCWEDNLEVKSMRNIFVGLFKSNERPIPIIPVCHHCMGGIRIDEYCRTNIEGLYACGEVTGGIHGANRMGGMALCDILVFGTRAGKYASEYARSTKNTQLDTKKVERKIKKFKHILEGKPDERYHPNNIRKKISRLLWYKMGMIRSRKSLQEALRELQIIRANALPKIFAKKPADFMLALECLNMHDVANVIAGSALKRAESRGAHYREDYPEKDDQNWMCNIMRRKRRVLEIPIVTVA